MKVFISWSGERSQALAHALRDWLPLVLHYVEPWLSEADVAAGERWAQAVATELEASNFGIICVTPENIGSPWVLFEAGALAKSMQGSRVIPLLFGLEFSDITGPLAQFQAKKVERVGLEEVILSINQAADHAIPEPRAKQLFDALWPEFEKQLKSIPDEAPTAKHMRPQHEILEELVTGVRSLDSRLRDLERVTSEEAPQSARQRRLMRVHPLMLRDIAHMMGEKPGDPIMLLVYASMFRDAIPFLYELGLEAYRAAKAGRTEEAKRMTQSLRRVAEAMLHGPLPLEELGLEPRLLDVISHEIDRFLSTEGSIEEESTPKGRRRLNMDQDC